MERIESIGNLFVFIAALILSLGLPLLIVFVVVRQFKTGPKRGMSSGVRRAKSQESVERYAGAYLTLTWRISKANKVPGQM
jgi:hypothetical protein